MATPSALGAFARNWCKRARRGLYGGKITRYGNNVSEDGGNRTRRTWKPNVQKKTYNSDILERSFQLRVTTHVIRCIDKAGGFDNYILKTKDHKLASDVGSMIKMEMEMEMEQRRLREQLEGGGGGEAIEEALRTTNPAHSAL